MIETIVQTDSKANIQRQHRTRHQKHNVLWTLLTTLALTTQTVNANTITALGAVIEPEKCYADLTEAAGGSNQLSATGFIEFIKLYSTNHENHAYFTNIQKFVDLPIQAVFNFHNLADTAGADGSKYIDITGAGTNQTPTTAQEEKLFDICKDVGEMIDDYVYDGPSTTTTTTTVGPSVPDKGETTATTTPVPPTTTTPNNGTDPLEISYSFMMGLNESKTNEEVLDGQVGRDVVDAIDGTMVIILDDIVDNLRLRGRRLGGESRGRRLDLTHENTAISAVNYAVCPDDAPNGTFCHTVTVDMDISGDDKDSITEDDVKDGLDEAIEDGTFASRLPDGSGITYTGSLDDEEDSGANETPGETLGGNAGISVGGIVGIAIAGVVALCCCAGGGYFFSKKRKGKEEKEESVPPGSYPSSVDDGYGYSVRSKETEGAAPRSPNYGGNILAKSQLQGFNYYEEEKVEEGETSISSGEEEVVVKEPIRAARKPPVAPMQRSVSSHSESSEDAKSQEDPRQDPRNRSPEDPRDAYYDAPANRSQSISVESSSNAGSSGWSSSEGLSSRQTQSVEDTSLDFQNNREPTLAAIAAASGRASQTESSPPQDQQQVQRVYQAPMTSAAAYDGNSTIESDTFSASSNPLSKNEVIERSSVPSVSQDARSDLDSAIEAGDWAAVGATAALLATASDTASYKSTGSLMTRSTVNSKSSKVSSIDAARAAEIDHLVDAGDWEGVVLAAAKFEAISDRDNDTTGSRSIASEVYTNPSAIDGSGTSSVGASSSAYSAGFSTSASETPSKAQKRAEIRMEVEALVRRVVPDEIDNVDEMMEQFKGREEELVETLRTMQERSIAQRARAAVNKSSRQDDQSMPSWSTATGLTHADRSASVPPEPIREEHDTFAENSQALTESYPDEEFAVNPLSEGYSVSDNYARPAQIAADASTHGSGSKGNSKSNKYSSNTTKSSATPGSRTALELAIEAGDWEAVGEAAAMMSDASVTTMSTNEIRDMAGSDYDSEYSGKRSREDVNANRAATLDNLIDKGDWTGVVAAASRYSESDRGLMSERETSSNFNTSTSGLTTTTGSSPIVRDGNNWTP